MLLMYMKNVVSEEQHKRKILYCKVMSFECTFSELLPVNSSHI